MLTHYQVLKIAEQASEKDIRKAYRKLMGKYHPDKNGNVTIDEQFYVVQEAYDTLSDRTKRSAYDARPRTNARRPPPRTPHPLQHEIRQRFKTLDAHIDTLKSETLPWFCYNQAIFIRALDQIHTKSGFFLYGLLKEDEVVLIQVFLNHTLTMLDALQTASETDDKLKVILNYATTLQNDEQAQALKELYGLQIDAIVDAHLAIISQEAPFYIESGLHHFDIQINRIATLPLRGTKKQAQHQLLCALHTFRGQMKEQLTASFDSKKDLLNLTALLSNLSYQDENLDQDNTILSTYHLPQENHSLPQTHPPHSLKTLLINALLWILSPLPKIQQRVKRYFEPSQDTTPSKTAMLSVIVTAMTNFLHSNQDEPQLPSEATPINWSTRHQAPITTTWSSQQRLRSNHPTTALTIFRENNSLGPSQVVLCRVVEDEHYRVSPDVSYHAAEGLMHEIIERRREEINEIVVEQKQLRAEQQALRQDFIDYQIALPKQIEKGVAELIANLTIQLTGQQIETGQPTNQLTDQKAIAGTLTKELESHKAITGTLTKELKEQKTNASTLTKELEENGKKFEEQKAVADKLTKELTDQKAVSDALTKELTDQKTVSDALNTKVERLEEMLLALMAEEEQSKKNGDPRLFSGHSSKTGSSSESSPKEGTRPQC